MTSGVAETDVSEPPVVAPRERLVDRYRRRRRSRGRHHSLTFWLLFRGLPVSAVLVALYLAEGLVIGAQIASRRRMPYADMLAEDGGSE